MIRLRAEAKPLAQVARKLDASARSWCQLSRVTLGARVGGPVGFFKLPSIHIPHLSFLGTKLLRGNAFFPYQNFLYLAPPCS